MQKSTAALRAPAQRIDRIQAAGRAAARETGNWMGAIDGLQRWRVPGSSVAENLQVRGRNQRRNEMDLSERCQWTWLHRGIGLGMRIPSARAGHRVWVVIYPLQGTRADSNAVSND
jgi:hypothetical protein